MSVITHYLEHEAFSGCDGPVLHSRPAAVGHIERRGQPPLLPLPLPYNPRFSRTQPDVQPLTAGRYLLVIEEAYLEDARAVLLRTGIRIDEERIASPFCLLAITVEPAAAGLTAWNGFRPVQTSAP
ncbi:MAG: hypothetical protein EOM10_14125 [Opitutae bacterium]|nr:hypothetical protein [Opitutae bacterium]